MTEMKIVVAMEENNIIAIKGVGIPWEIPEDKEHYRNITQDQHLLLGRKTYDRIGQEITKPSIVMSRDVTYNPSNPNVNVATSREEAYELMEDIDGPIYNIGGSVIYSIFFDDADELIVSHINGSYRADDPTDELKFPPIDTDEKWDIKSAEVYDEFQVVTYTRLE